MAQAGMFTPGFQWLDIVADGVQLQTKQSKQDVCGAAALTVQMSSPADLRLGA